MEKEVISQSNIEKLHEVRRHCVNFKKLHIVYTGGGARFIDEIMSEPGASEILLSATNPYSIESQNLFVNENIFNLPRGKEKIKDWKRCSDDAAYLLNLANAFKYTEHNHSVADDVMFVSVAASMQNSKDPNLQRGGRVNTAFINIIVNNCMYESGLELDRGQTRSEQEQYLSDILFKLITEIEDGSSELVAALKIEERNSRTFINCLKSLAFEDKLEIYSGSFAPWHAGHAFIKDYGESNNLKVLEIPYCSFGKEPATQVDKNLFATDTIVVRTPNTHVLEKLLFFKFLSLKRFYIDETQESRYIYKMGSDTLNRIDETDLRLLQEAFGKSLKFQVFDRFEAYKEDFLDELNQTYYRLATIENFEFISTPKAIKGISSTKIRK